MFSSPMSHYFRHILLAYKNEGKSLQQRLVVANKLSSLETSLLRLQGTNPNHPKLQKLLGRIRGMKASLY
ncbi:hypothetical protein HYY73_02195 [Candidatus Woesearchaeota archaeon]|nr:hypothetical protein [Candidatus Woesearchaeota archaeon]